MPLLENSLALHVRNHELPHIQPDLPLHRESRINLVFDGDVYSGINFLALNPEEGYGLLQVLDADDRPYPRNIVIYEALPNELPRVAGIITTVPQTPLSHVNLRAVQDGIPNAYIRSIRDDAAVAPLIGSYVRYEVTDSSWDLRAATKEEVDAHYEASRPQPQTPEQDLSVTEITPLDEIGFDDWLAFGVKAANVAVLGTLDFPEGTVPEGFAIPFHFYDEFMKANGFYDAITEMLADSDFQTDFDVQDDMLDDLRDDIEDGDTPQWIIDALTTMHATYPGAQSLRYRSSTNNEDLPGFNGAGLYDSKTQDPEETEEDGIDKSLKGVFASLWTFRAFTEREFHRIDHRAVAMGVLVHPNCTDELVNGVAVSFDPFYGLEDYIYVNSQVGEELVSNPAALSVQEEILIGQNGYDILNPSNQVPVGQLLMDGDDLTELRERLIVIHDHFEGLYDPGPSDPFAMEIEFKITSEDVLAIKQARPWVFGGAAPPPPDRPGTVTLRSTQPRVGAALSAALSDPDGSISNISWQWAWSTNGGAASAVYTPVAGDVGKYLRAVASYTDGHGPGKSAQATSTNRVQGATPPTSPPPPVIRTTNTGGGGGVGFVPPAPPAPPAPPRPVSNFQGVGQLFQPLTQNNTLGRVWRLIESSQRWLFYDPSPDLVPFNTLRTINLVSAPPVVVAINVTRSQQFRGLPLYAGWNFVLVKAEPVAAQPGSKSQPVEQLLRPLADSGVLQRVWWLNNRTQEWLFYDPDPAFESFNTLTTIDLSANPTVVLAISMSRQQEFRGRTLYPGWNYVVMR